MNIYSDVSKVKELPNSTLSDRKAGEAAELFRSFSDTSRVKIIYTLIGSEMNVGSLAAVIGISESAVSHHLRGLRQMKIVNSRREGKEVFYRVDDDHIITLFQQGINHVLDESQY
jgi:ArsR family transcriptional regulator, lead/cadmium/zinc/bismuth-responsive transcriptional repressor